MKMADIISIGEMLVDFTAETTPDGAVRFYRNPGGAPAMVAVMAARAGASSAFIGKLGKDLFGKYLKSELESHGVDTSGVILDKEHQTTLAFVGTDEDNEREFVFYRKNSADVNLSFNEIKKSQLDKCRIIHFGALSLTNEPTRSATLNAIEYCKEQGKIISYDPNWREQLWESKSEAFKIMRSVVPLCDIIKVSEKELKIISDYDNMLTGTATLLSKGVKAVIVTQGAKGCVIATKKGIIRSASYKVEVLDTLGTGDSFQGAFLAKLAETGKKPEELEISELESIADYANACGALCSTKYGAIPSMPSNEEILECMKNVPRL